jgi:HEAT repeat protein
MMAVSVAWSVLGWVEAALGAARAGDGDRCAVLVVELHLRGGAEALAAAQRLCGSPEAVCRALGVDILAQLGAAAGGDLTRHVLHPAIVEGLLETAGAERDPLVLAALAVAFGHRRDLRCLPVLAGWRTHPDPEVRHAVAVSAGTLQVPAAYDVLIELSGDPEPWVRDWATFGLARQTDADFPRLRDALAARTGDPDRDTRTEAVYGLATRGDPRAIPALLDLLATPAPDGDIADLDEALHALAAATDDPRLRQHLAAGPCGHPDPADEHGP